MQLAFEQLAISEAKPFLKWAGGKSQLLEQMTTHFPTELMYGKIKRYVEPFVGSGAVFFYVAQHYDVQEFFIFDINDELILAYKTIRQNVESLINLLIEIQDRYFSLTPDEQKNYFYQVRSEFNLNRSKINFAEFHTDWIERTAQLIFLNRTCFNGLFRVNFKSEFNVPFGSYKNPKICNAKRLRAVSKTLQRAIIQQGDFTVCAEFVNGDTFVYFDPPYRPISQTASFTSYSNYNFDDTAQLRLAEFFKQLDAKGAKLMLSNSDPKNKNPNDHFFENAYQSYRVKRVRASRVINSNAKKRGQIYELLIMNYGDQTK